MRIDLRLCLGRLHGRRSSSRNPAVIEPRVGRHDHRSRMLYTDLANPTSNSIYQAVGYRRCGDAQEYLFRSDEPAA